ncbi:Small heat shock protein, chloroplastic [Dendrobium catenatum]|uniref:Small heat shock protein, chloroplastic n=1 Tax=Dendrobium catenatum TaxID=906689 RepID=A0A2I0WSP4_9ASPA|nr:Small heat shock protein, chloroplastic [Dendrobium catenatum]
MSTAFSLHQIPFTTASPSLRRQIRCTAPRISRSDSLDHLQRIGKQQQPVEAAQTIRRRSPPIGLWDRFPAARTVQQMMDTMDRLIEDPIEPAVVAGALNGYRRGGRTPWEIREAEGEYKMRFDIPGMTKKDVRVWVEEGMLVIKAEKAAAEEGQGEGEGEGGWPAASFGRYSSRIALPENATVEKIGAEVRDGVLYVTVPKASPSSKVLDIQVQ